MDRARIVGLYNAVYGVGSASGVTGFPFGDYIRKEAIKAGYVVGDNWITGLMEGLPAYLMAYISGGGDARKGEWFNFGERYGSQGFELLKQVLRNDVPWYRLIGGASQSVLANMIESMDPMFRWIGNVARDNAESKFPLRPEDVIAPLNEVQSVSATRRLLQAYNTGHWLSKKGYDLGETSMAKAAFMAATGMQAQRVNDAYLKKDIEKEQKEAQQDSLNKAVMHLRASFQAQKDKNPSAAEDYYRRAFAVLEADGFPKERYIDVIAKAKEKLGDLMEEIDYGFYLRNVPEKRGILPFVEDKDNKGTRLDAYKRQLQINNEKRN